MKVAIMQPYFLPYIGYFQLIASVDLFIVYDNIKYTKKGWINRNRMLLNGTDSTFTLPLKNAPDHLDVRERELADDFDPERLLNQFRGAYSKAPYFRETIAVLETVLRFPERNLFRFLLHSLTAISRSLEIATRFEISSSVDIDHSLKSQDKVLALCKAVSADVYINAIGGQELYSKEDFQRQGIALKFIQSLPFVYSQFKNEFVPWLSIIDVMMFNPPSVIKQGIESNYNLI